MSVGWREIVVITGIGVVVMLTLDRLGVIKKIARAIP